MKRVKQLVPLSHEHHHGLVLAQKVLRLNEAAELSDIQTAWQGLKAYFQGPARQHFLVEEHYLLEPLSVFEDYKTLVDRIYDEHQQFLAFANEPVGRNLQALQNIAGLLKSHIKCEEQQLFEAAQQALSKKQLNALLQAHEPAK